MDPRRALAYSGLGTVRVKAGFGGEHEMARCEGISSGFPVSRGTALAAGLFQARTSGESVSITNQWRIADVQEESLEKHSVTGRGGDETQAGFILGLPARREEVSLALTQVVGGGSFGLTVRRDGLSWSKEVEGYGFVVILILPQGIRGGDGVFGWNCGDGWRPTGWCKIGVVEEIVAVGWLGRKGGWQGWTACGEGGKVEVRDVVNDGGGNYLLMMRKGRKGDPFLPAEE